MKVGEYRFTDYYHQFMTIEADDLTEELKDQIEIHDDDCFALCSSYCARDGLLEFNVLSVGSSWENCTNGLEKPEMLGVFSIDQVFDKTARIAEPTYEMIQKNTPWMERRDAGTDDDLLMTRRDPRLDGLRWVQRKRALQMAVSASHSIISSRFASGDLKFCFLPNANHSFQS